MDILANTSLVSASTFRIMFVHKKNSLRIFQERPPTKTLLGTCFFKNKRTLDFIIAMIEKVVG